MGFTAQPTLAFIHTDQAPTAAFNYYPTANSILILLEYYTLQYTLVIICTAVSNTLILRPTQKQTVIAPHERRRKDRLMRKNQSFVWMQDLSRSYFNPGDVLLMKIFIYVLS